MQRGTLQQNGDFVQGSFFAGADIDVWNDRAKTKALRCGSGGEREEMEEKGVGGVRWRGVVEEREGGGVGG